MCSGNGWLSASFIKGKGKFIQVLHLLSKTEKGSITVGLEILFVVYKFDSKFDCIYKVLYRNPLSVYCIWPSVVRAIITSVQDI